MFVSFSSSSPFVVVVVVSWCAHARPPARARACPHIFGVENIAKEIHSGQKMLIRSREYFKRRDNVYNLDTPSLFYLPAAALTSERGGGRVVGKHTNNNNNRRRRGHSESRPPVATLGFLADPVISGGATADAADGAADVTTSCAYGRRRFRSVTPGDLWGAPSVDLMRVGGASGCLDQ